MTKKTKRILIIVLLIVSALALSCCCMIFMPRNVNPTPTAESAPILTTEPTKVEILSTITSLPTLIQIPTSVQTLQCTVTSVPTLEPTIEPTQTAEPVPTQTAIVVVPTAKAEMWLCPDSTEGAAYVGSKDSDKFHTLSCRYAKTIHAENRVCFANRNAAINAGYVPCKTCSP